MLKTVMMSTQIVMAWVALLGLVADLGWIDAAIWWILWFTHSTCVYALRDPDSIPALAKIVMMTPACASSGIILFDIFPALARRPDAITWGISLRVIAAAAAISFLFPAVHRGVDFTVEPD
ncbi:hypothetical protein KEM60_01066 [Austwickia sp. TVS 96-490-7B]|uniref:hypothetical protein n=1 Tax=Austwickia sp. TVS 96-490-7B TaxID=2830843 RepID=UPI001C55F454|nr:hypothetical protein [Austwickia sp. TVS 96-490-7B]MBW3084877.1 hypothetical protein [Austwickia sp. TVS 96-490-7B]